MALVDIPFQWRRCPSGYETREVEGMLFHPTTRTLPPGPDDKLRYEMDMEMRADSPSVYIAPRTKQLTAAYVLQHHPTAYREFAKLDGSAEACIGFAAVHGLLFGHHPDGEPIEIWRPHIRDMRRQIDAWQKNPMALAPGFCSLPPHRSRRAQLTHQAPSSGSGVEVVTGHGM